MDNQTSLPKNQPLSNDPLHPAEQVAANTSEKPKNNLPILIGMLFMFSILFGVVGYYLGRKSLPSSSISLQTNQVVNSSINTDLGTGSSANPQIISSPPPAGEGDETGKFGYGSFSLSYPNDWRFLSRDEDENFPLKERLSFDEKVVALEKNGIYLIVNISKADQMESGGIFTNDTEFNEFAKDKELLRIEDTTFYLMKSHPSVSSLENSHSGSAGWGSLIEYVPSKMTASGNIFNGYESIIKRNGQMFNFILVGESEGQTPVSIQNDLKEILQSIKW